jgi:hypothetical protein
MALDSQFTIPKQPSLKKAEKAKPMVRPAIAPMAKKEALKGKSLKKGA